MDLLISLMAIPSPSNKDLICPPPMSQNVTRNFSEFVSEVVSYMKHGVKYALVSDIC
jgi:hypothetical protein